MKRRMITGFTVVLGAAIAVFGCAASSPPATTKVEPQLQWTKIGHTPGGDARNIYVACYNGYTLFFTDTFSRTAEVTPVYRPNSGC